MNIKNAMEIFRLRAKNNPALLKAYIKEKRKFFRKLKHENPTDLGGKMNTPWGFISLEEIEEINEKNKQNLPKFVKISEQEVKHRKNFIDEIIIIYHKYGLALSHEDTHGAFIVEVYDEQYEDWLKDCFLQEGGRSRLYNE